MDMSCLVSLSMMENNRGVCIKRRQRLDEKVVLRSVCNGWLGFDKVLKKVTNKVEYWNERVKARKKESVSK